MIGQRTLKLRGAKLIAGLGWIILTGGGGSKSSNPSDSTSVNTKEDGFHLTLISGVKKSNPSVNNNNKNNYSLLLYSKINK